MAPPLKRRWDGDNSPNKPPCHSGHDRRSTHQWEAVPNGGKRGTHATAIRRDDRPRDSTTRQPAIKTGQIPSRHHWRTPKAEGAGSWMGRPGQGSSRPSPAAPQLFKIAEPLGGL